MRGSSQPLAVPTGRSMADEAVRHGAIDLAQGVLHSEPPGILLDILTEVLRHPRAHVYAPPQGIPEYLEAVSELLAAEGLNVTAENLLGSSGNTGGLMAALIEHCRPGDGVLLPEPFYPAHLWAIRAARCEPVFLPCDAHFQPDTAALAALLPTVRAAIICNPANPSGFVWSRELLGVLVARAQEREIPLIVDETYKDYVWEGEFITPLTLTSEWSHLVVLRSFSKTLAIAGWRAGYTIASPERIQRMTHQIHDALYVGAPTLPQLVLARALREHRGELEAFIARNVTLYAESRVRIAEAFREIGMEPALPAGAFYMLVKHNQPSDIEATKKLLAAGVAVAPGQAFFRDPSMPSGTIRIHFAVAPETVAKVREKLFAV